MNSFTRSIHPYYTDRDFCAKLPMYRTAWSTVHETYVGLRAVWRDTDNVPVISAHVLGTPDEETHLFRPTELINYVL
jgi:hypothetical protein